MIEMLRYMINCIPKLLPFIAFAFLAIKININRRFRYRQMLMPIVGLVYSLFLIIMMVRLNAWVYSLIEQLASFLQSSLLSSLDSALGSSLSSTLGSGLTGLLQNADIVLLLFYVETSVSIALYQVIKLPFLKVFSRICNPNKLWYEPIAGLAYEKDEEDTDYHLKESMVYARDFAMYAYIASIVIMTLAAMVSCYLYHVEVLAAPFYPAVAIIIIGELAFALQGLTQKEDELDAAGEDDKANVVGNYAIMRNVLRKLFKDKLAADDTCATNDFAGIKTNRELLDEIAGQDTDYHVYENYTNFIQSKIDAGLEVNQDYVKAGSDLIDGKSILFNNPFYSDLIPYAFYEMNRTLMSHKKVTVILGRHGIEDSIIEWCREGLREVANIPDLWRIGLLDQAEDELDVGILTRADVNDLKVHEKNVGFLYDTAFVVIVEPSRLVTTSQIGLNSLARQFKRDGKHVVYCSMDKNCDGLVDSLSHILMESFTEVSASGHQQGIESYMVWDGDGEHLQHRMLPNISRYLGLGTELSVEAIKNQIKKTTWYGGEAFPVMDIHWIAEQYYSDLMGYCGLKQSQNELNDHFKASAGMWSAPIEKRQYITVEDESYNVFEVRRNFSTRAKTDGFVNIITSDYLLKDYMTDNETVFRADPKAVPYIVADYAHTERNVALRLALRMATGYVYEEEVKRELELIAADVTDPIKSLWHLICKVSQDMDFSYISPEGDEKLVVDDKGKRKELGSSDVIFLRKKYDAQLKRMINVYYVKNDLFVKAVVNDLDCAEYVAENEAGSWMYLGNEIRGQVFQRYLPGQFFVCDGKYYEMLGTTHDGNVLLRRAADHITGRPQYRQERMYTLSHITPSEKMGDIRRIGDVEIAVNYADITAKTDSYWKMERYNDFKTARKVTVNGVPERRYHTKRVLTIKLGDSESITKEVLDTVALLMNETFRSMFAENQCFIAAVTKGEASIPLTYSLTSETDELDDSCIYIIEDSQLDIGLLDAVSRNTDRILSIICDYLEWHYEAMERSINPPVPPIYEIPIPEPKAPAKRKGLLGIIDSIKGFFGKIFKKKPGKPGKTAEPTPEAAPAQEAPAEGADAAKDAKEEKPKKKRRGLFGWGKKDKDEATEEPVAEEAPVTEETAEEETPETEEVPTAEVTEEEVSAAEDAEAEESEVPDESEDETADKSEPEDSEEEAENEEEEIPEEAENLEDEDESEDDKEDEDEGEVVLASIAPTLTEEMLEELNKEEKKENPETPAEDAEPAAEPEATEETPEVTGEDTEIDAEIEAIEGEIAAEEAEPTEPTEPETETEPTEPADTEFEPDEAAQVTVSAMDFDTEVIKRKPYHERYYLLYGGEEVPEHLDIKGALEGLRALGYGNSEMKQARDGRDTAQKLEGSYGPDRKKKRYCDFCGRELSGTEYEVLKDGRERCMVCSRSAVKTEKEFIDMYKQVLNNLDIYYGIKVNKGVRVRMVNSKTLHKKLGKTFTPTAEADARILGVAIKKRDGYELLIENGSPRIMAVMTMAHELTHIWQYDNWNAASIKAKYGALELEVYEGMAKWSEIQYAYLAGEKDTAKREELITRMRNDEYGRGFLRYVNQYPLSYESSLNGETPFDNKETPLEIS